MQPMESFFKIDKKKLTFDLILALFGEKRP